MAKSDVPQAEMPRYCVTSEIIHALKIAAIKRDGEGEPDRETDGSAIITPVEAEYAPFRVTREYMRDYGPQVGGYFIIFPNGRQSFAPVSSFKTYYTRVR